MVAFSKYENYKDTSISWIQNIPTTWKIERAKWLFRKMERPVRSEDDVVTAFRDGEVTLRKNRREEGFTNAIQEHGYQGIRSGDLVISAMDAFAGAIGVSDSDGKSTPVYSVCIPSGEFYVNNYYYAYLIRYMAKSGFILSLSKGIRERSTDFRFNDFANLYLPIPSKEEQDKIVEFLDRKTAEIDQAIEQKQRLIRLIKEQKAILIDRAVTKGLNPNVPMRDSGVDWIGEIPESWEIYRAKYLFKEINDRSKTGEEELLSVSHLTGVTPRSEKNVSMFMAEDYSGSKLCQKDDLVINIMWAWMGALGVSKQTGIVSSSYGVFRQLKQNTLNSWYLEHLLRSRDYVAEYNRISTGLHSSRLRLYAVMFLGIDIILPSKQEQDLIEYTVTQKTHEIDMIIDAAEREMKILEEFRSIIISQAVTGKMKIQPY